MSPDRIITFGEFRLDPVSGHLYRGDEIVPLAPKSFAVLQFLASQSGRLVSKQELLTAVWPGVFVGDAVLKSTIRELRKALGDDSHEPRFIETAHRRGYRFVAPVSLLEPAVIAASAPRVSYARSGNVNIAYQVIGSGPIDLVFVMGWVSHLEYFWNEPSFARFLTRLSSMARLILFDKRGTGLSDPVPVSELPSLDIRLDGDAERTRRDAAGAIKDLASRPAAGLVSLGEFDLEDGVERIVNHKLGRVPVVFLGPVRGPSTVGMIELVRINRRSVTLKASGYGATVTVNVVVM
jgi:DNA-binding winged helix-turn-helix (wHTH) protein